MEDALRDLPWANPSSLHTEGRSARAALDQARDRAAAALGVEPRSIIFCASGTEACNLALMGWAGGLDATSRVVTWASEHQAVLSPVRELMLRGRQVDILPVDGAARADAAGIQAGAGLVSICQANSELGTVQPVEEIAARAHALGALIHLDAGSAPRWLRPPVEALDLASFSGPKLGAGRGGLLMARSPAGHRPLLFGGPQEWGLRAGREDVAAATAVSIALEVCARRRQAESARADGLSRSLRAALSRLGGRLTGTPLRLPNFATAVLPRRRGEDMLLELDLRGAAASSGSACASGSLDPSHVLLATGHTLEEAIGSLRLTTGYDTTEDDVRRMEIVLESVLGRVAARG